MTDMTTDTANTDAAGHTQAGQDFLAQGNDLLDSATKSASSFLSQAQDAVSAALTSTVEAVKERPVAAAAIAAGAAAAVALGANMLREGSDAGPASRKKKA